MPETLDTLWDDVNRMSDSTFPGWRGVGLLYWATSLAGEVGEFCNLAKKVEEGGPRAQGVTKAALLEELADVYIYLQKTVESLGGDRERFAVAVREKAEKVRLRQGRVPD